MQGICGGPIMPMSQTLLLRIFPPAPARPGDGHLGHDHGGRADRRPDPRRHDLRHHRLAVDLLHQRAGGGDLRLLRPGVAALATTPPTERTASICVGLALLVIFVGALQIMLDKGKELDWFGLAGHRRPGRRRRDRLRRLPDLGADRGRHPIVNLRVFRHRGFSSAVTTLALTFGAFFASIVLMPLWLQTNMGYTATWGGYVTAFGGVLAVVMSPIVPRLMNRFDSRALITFGVLWMCGIALIRTQLASNANYWVIALPFLAQGLAMPFFFIPTNQLALTSVPPNETAAAAGLSNFLRTMSAAVSVSVVTTLWDNAAGRNHFVLAGRLNDAEATTNTLTAAGLSPDQALAQLDGLTQSQSVMMATDQLFGLTSVVFLLAAAAVWLSPKPKPAAGPMPAGH